MIDRSKKVSDMTAGEIQDLVSNVPKTYFVEACKQANKECQRNWQTDLHEMGEKVTGLDTRKAESKDHIRGVYKYAEGMQDRSKIFGRTFLVESVKWAGIAAAIFLGLKK